MELVVTGSRAGVRALVSGPALVPFEFPVSAPRRSTQALLPAFPGLRQKARTAGKAADGQTSKNGVDSALHLQIYAFCVGPYIVV